MKPIIVEGPDGAGKSTLIQGLELLLETKAHHGGGPPKTVEELRERLDLSLNEYRLFDRWSAISEIVYPQAFGKDSLVPHEELFTALADVRPLIIYCRPPMHVLNENKAALEIKKEHKDELHCKRVKDNLKKIVYIYDNLMDTLLSQGYVVLKYDYTGIN